MVDLFISVLMPVYNRQNSVKRSVKSILDQSYTKFELIIIDDASTDQTSEIIKTINDDRIIYVKLDKNVGAACARNEGIKKARSNWLAFHDSDDLWEPSKLEKQVQLIDESIPTIIFTSFIRHKRGNHEYIPSSRMIEKEGDMHRNLLLGNFIAAPTVLLHKECLLTSGCFNENMPRFQDWELWIRLSRQYSIIWIDEPLVQVYYTENSISSNESKLITAYDLLWKLHKSLFIDAGPKYAARFLFSYGHNLALYGDVKKSRKVLLNSLAIKLFSVNQLLCYSLTFLGQRIYRFFYTVIK
ncbi:glycosyltransferase family 2 protein [Paenibacillus lautus]|uniref:glycosyltransferase family 2 protein n=1 Tax=Paenibacillus lautus TaxID=1401 RepID=UPI001C7D80D5|nr:glycosyltransferase family 2 protein [Paenibacillus lautus]MBX4152344.1 glycosyltransferase family 2 protein [Paenibacillus lautus]